MNKLTATLIVPTVMLGVFLTSGSAHAKEVDPPLPVNIEVLRENEPVIQESSEIVSQKSADLEKTTAEIESTEKKKADLSTQVDDLKKQLEEMKAKVAEKKAREEAARLASVQPVQAAQVAPAAQATVAQPIQAAPQAARPRPYVGGPNAYAVGWCTWWVKEKRPDIGGYWGDAGYSWIYTAQAAGYSTGSVPEAGAIGVMSGHVAYVESVNGDGTANISEMGWNYMPGTAHYRTVPASTFTYIY